MQDSWGLSHAQSRRYVKDAHIAIVETMRLKKVPEILCGSRDSGIGVSRLRRSSELRPVLPVLTSFSKRWREVNRRAVGIRFLDQDGQVTRSEAFSSSALGKVHSFGVFPHGAVPSVLPLCFLLLIPLALFLGHALLARR